MKLKLFFLGMIFFATPLIAKTNNNGLNVIATRGYVACGTNLSNTYLAYKDVVGNWQGIDADLCRAFAMATLGDENAFDMIDVATTNAAKALDSGKIDIMLGNNAISAKQEISSPISAMDVLYIDKQMFASRHKSDAESMETYKENKVCTVSCSVEE